MERGLTRPGRRYYLNTPGTILYVAGVCIACWIGAYLSSNGFPVAAPANTTSLWKAVAGGLSNEGMAYAAGMVVLAGAALLLQRVNYSLMLIRQRTILPLLLYLLYVSTNPSFIPLNPSSVCVFCLVMAVYLLFKSYHDDLAVGNAYNEGLLIAIGSLFWIHILWFFPFFWRGMYSFRTWSIKTVTASLFGLVTVYWFVFGWCVWQQDFTPITQSFAQLFRFDLIPLREFGLLDWLSAILVGLITVASIVHFLAHELEDNLRTRQLLWFLIFFTAWTFILFMVFAKSSVEFLQIFCIPAAILTAHFFTLRRNKYTVGLFHLMVICCVALFFIRLWNF